MTEHQRPLKEFDSDVSEAYEMYHLLLQFAVKYEIYESKRPQLKQFLGKAFGSDDRALEAAVGQFLAQLDHIYA